VPEGPKVEVIRPISDSEYAAWLAEVVPAYAADKVASGDWTEASAVERSRMEYESLLPQGKDTPGHYLLSIVGFDGETVGTMWFAAKDEGKDRIAYVYDVTVSPAHQRQGHAFRAFLAVEAEARRLGLAGIGLHVFGHNTGAQALYAKLGFMPTHINLYKPLAGPAAQATAP
jgi:ribosomal protein S18 acetylase RimI-like enzyme